MTVSTHRQEARVITVVGVGDLSPAASQYIFDEARRQHRSIFEVAPRIVARAVVEYARSLGEATPSLRATHSRRSANANAQ